MPRRTDNFNKFYNKKNNAAIKEGIRQEKKAAKKERKEAIERHFEAKRQARAEQQAADPSAKGAGLSTKGAGPSNKTGGPPTKSASPSIKDTSSRSSASFDANLMPLNKYIAHGGLCSRRDAAELIRQGKVLVNGKLVTEPGTKVAPSDTVKVSGKTVTISRNFVYILLNKPKDYITTTDDPQGRKTVLDLTRQATTERVFPVGRLDRNTSGVLLLTNDGELAQKLAHPKHEIKKIYHVTLDKPLTKADFDKIAEGVMLEDGMAHVDVLAYADAKDKTQIGLEIHSGRNRIVRRIFEHLGYDVRGLDRVMYAGLTKKNVQRGHWRLLTEKEIRILKYLNASFRGSLAHAPAAGKSAGPVKSDALTRSAGPDESTTPDKSAVPGRAPRSAGQFKRPRPAGRTNPAGYSKPATSGRPPKPAGRTNPDGNGKPAKSTGPDKSTRPTKSARPDKSTRRDAPPAALRGRKSSGSYNKSKARDQQRKPTIRKRNDH